MGKIDKKRVGLTPGVRLTQNVQDSQKDVKLIKRVGLTQSGQD